jgi:hypothetical protein
VDKTGVLPKLGILFGILVVTFAFCSFVRTGERKPYMAEGLGLTMVILWAGAVDVEKTTETSRKIRDAAREEKGRRPFSTPSVRRRRLGSQI